MDSALGAVMASVRSEARVASSTLVFFTSDNGSPQRPDGNLPLRGYKDSICECTLFHADNGTYPPIHRKLSPHVY